MAGRTDSFSQVTKSGGRAIVIGMGTLIHTLPIAEASSREIDITPTWRYANCYPQSIEIMEALNATLRWRRFPK
jgi:hypothetical protein